MERNTGSEEQQQQQEGRGQGQEGHQGHQEQHEQDGQGQGQEEQQEYLLTKLEALLELLKARGEEANTVSALQGCLVQLRELGDPIFSLQLCWQVAAQLHVMGLHSLSLEYHQEWLRSAEEVEAQDEEILKEVLLKYTLSCCNTSRFDEAQQLFSRLKDLIRGVPVFDEIVAIHRQAYDNPSVLGIYESLGDALCSMGSLEESLECRRKALEFSVSDFEKVCSLGNVSGTLRKLGRLDEAIEASNQSYALLASTPDLRVNNLQLLVREYSNRTGLLIERQEYDKALQLVNESYAILLQSNHSVAPAELLNLFMIVGRMYQRVGNSEAALRTYDHVLQNSTDSHVTLEMHQRIADILMRFGCFALAMPVAERCILLEKGENASAHLMVGTVALRLGENEKALHHLQLYLQASESTGRTSMFLKPSNAMAEYYFEVKEYEKALQFAEKCMAIPSASLIDQARALATKVQVLTALKAFDEALIASDACIATCEQLMNVDGLGRAHFNCGRLHSKMGNISEAVKQLETAICIYERFDSGLTNDRLTTSYNTFAGIMYRELVEVYCLAGDYEMALFTSERGRCKGFMKLLRAEQMVRRGICTAGASQVPENATSLNVFVEDQSTRVARLAELWDAVRDLGVPVLEYHARADEKHVDCWLLLPQSEAETGLSLHYACSSLASVVEGTGLSESVNLLQLAQRALTSMSLGHWFNVNVDTASETEQELQLLGLNINSVGIDSKISFLAPSEEVDITSVHDAATRADTSLPDNSSESWDCSSDEYSSSEDDEDVRTHDSRPYEFQESFSEAVQSVRTAARVLFNLFLGPFKDFLSNLPRNQEILIVPHRATATVPFAVLLDAEEDRFMVERFAFSYSAAIMIAAELRRRHKQRCPGSTLVRKCAVLGKADFQNHKPIKQVTEEVTKLTEFLESKHIEVHFTLTPTVTEALQFLEDDGCDILHIASHGTMYGNVILGHPEQLNTDDELTRHKIYALETTVKPVMVVLNTCLGGTGNVNADGVDGIVRALLGRGTMSVLCCLANEKDKSAKHVVLKLYNMLLRKGKSTAQALALAQRREMKKANNRYEVCRWGPFTCYGLSVCFETPEDRVR